MPKPSFEEQLHRTLVQFLTDAGRPELAAVMIDGEVQLLHDETGYVDGIAIDVPTHAYALITQDPSLRETLFDAARTVVQGHLRDLHESGVLLRVKLISPEPDWQQIARDLIVNYKPTNQATVSKKLAARDHRDILNYNEANYASQAEIRIAQEMEERQVLFFPLPLAIRADTGVLYRDRREPDFLVCDEGTWGILEVSFHPNRFEKDKEKDAWFKKSGILCVEHYTAERCYNEPARVVDEFLAILAKHRR